MQFDLTLYLITDDGYLEGRDWLKAIEDAIKGGVTIVQYRSKNLSKTTREMYEELLQLRELTKRYNVPLIVNDRIDLALAVDADGVHIGQDDLPAEVVRKILGKEKIIGISTHSIEEVKAANNLPVDYIAFGSIFRTPTKEKPLVVGTGLLKEAKEVAKKPLVAIGGIMPYNVEEVIKVGVDGVAVISAILGFQDTFKSAESIKRAIERTRRELKLLGLLS
ncbi:MAG TPA: thiamine phosphate synthase [Aquifex aeolicus]|uniref:Thiamine-phosphate synthase n=1 Tax=Aquifex aeolicus TaxID=63363 RepID=A0A9D1CG23_AQUAO|nr:thiamine phosphate synthase [Aquificales bacterium]HIP98737.1 thiamine phosphate synthase [Aquifex aeolicus]HIQ26716.1 thiamine phosphate synthase [Aquifex aeolicus]